MERSKKVVVLPKKKVVISTKVTSYRPKKKGHEGDVHKDVLHCHGGKERAYRRDSLRKEKSVSDLMTELILNDHEKENMFDMMSLDDIRKKPDLWMAAFDNPLDFIKYCRKRLDHERELLENSRQVEDEILQFVRDWSKNTEKHANILGDLYKVQNINDKLQEVIMEERTHCQHLVGKNYQLETQRQILSRKYQAALLLGKVDEKSVHHLLEKNPRAVPLADRLSDLGKKINECDGKNKLGEVADPTVLANRVQTLEKYIDSLMKQHREEVLILKETISQGDLKCEAIKAQYTDLLQRNTKSLDELKEVLGASIRENLNLRDELLKKDAEFFDLRMNEMSDRLRKSSNRQYNIVSSFNKDFFKIQCDSEETTAIEKECQVKLAKSEIDLARKANLLRETVNKMVILERKCARLEEENQLLRKTNERSLKVMKSKNEVLEKRCEKTESRLKMENAGVLHDIRECKTLIKLLIRNVKSFTKEQGELKKKLLHCDKDKVNTAVNEPEAVERLKSGTSQTSSDVRMHAMNLWVNYLENKVRDIEEEAVSSRHNQQDDDTRNDLRIEYMNPHPHSISTAKDDELAIRKHNKRTDGPTRNPEISEMDIVQLMPPKWVTEKLRSSRSRNHYVDDDGFESYDISTNSSGH